MTTESRNHGQLTPGSGQSTHTSSPRFRNLGSRARNKAGHWKEQGVWTPKTGSFLSRNAMFSHPIVKETQVKWSQKNKIPWQSNSWGAGKKAESCHTGSDCGGESHGPKCWGGQISSINIHERGKGGKPFPSSVAGLGTRLRSPAGLPQINIRAEGTDLLLSKISKLRTRVGEKTGRI